MCVNFNKAFDRLRVFSQYVSAKNRLPQDIHRYAGSGVHTQVDMENMN